MFTVITLLQMKQIPAVISEVTFNGFKHITRYHEKTKDAMSVY